MLLLECWKPIVGWEDIYEVSVTGVVRRTVTKGKSKAGTVIKGCLHTNGYRMTALSRNNKMTHEYVHRVVCAAFLGPCPEGCEVNHIDLSKTSNRLSNLEYVTHAANINHAAKSGAFYKVTAKKLTEDMVRAIRRAGSAARASRLAKEHGVTKSTICKVLNRDLWGWVE